MDKEVMNPSASTEHERACGAWMDKSLVQNVEYFALDDSTERAEAVRHAEAAQHAGTRLSSTNLGKFRAACQRAVLGGSAALRSAGELAYQHLIAAADINGVTDNETALQSLGKLVGHYCDGPILFGWELKVNGTRTSVRRGRAFEPYAMASAMQLVRAPVALQLSAEVGNKHVNDYGYSSPEASWSQIMMVLRSATERPISDDPLADANYADPYQAEFDGFVDLLANGALADAKGYLHGVAGMCAFSLEAIVSSPGYTATDAAWNWRSRIQREEPRAAALGSLQPPPGHSPMFEVDGTDVLNASSITMSQLVGAPSGDADTACLAFTRLMFPDEIERMHFDLVISPTLYDRMESMVAQVRAGTAHVLRNDATIRGALTDPDTVAGYVDVARIRIPGAPRGTWAGSSRSIPVATFDSSDGVFIMAAKQARALYLDRQSSLVYDATHPCEGPSYYTALTANAFIFPSYRCSYYLLGMSWRPYADAQYDDASLASRFGYIIAHELSHLNLAVSNGYNQPQADVLLADYPCLLASTRDEAWADVCGTLGVLQTGLLNSAALCQHISQSWCARTPVGYNAGCWGQSHPLPNSRGDSICKTLRRLGV